MRKKEFKILKYGLDVELFYDIVPMIYLSIETLYFDCSLFNQQKHEPMDRM